MEHKEKGKSGSTWVGVVLLGQVDGLLQSAPFSRG